MTYWGISNEWRLSGIIRCMSGYGMCAWLSLISCYQVSGCSLGGKCGVGEMWGECVGGGGRVGVFG